MRANVAPRRARPDLAIRDVSGESSEAGGRYSSPFFSMNAMWLS
jgi:hypothetical protein